MRDLPGQQFRFPKEKGYVPRRPSTAGNQRSLPGGPRDPRGCTQCWYGTSRPARHPANVPRGRGRREGRCHRNSAQYPGPRRAAEAREEGSRDPLCPKRTHPAVPSQSGFAQPAAPPQLRAFPRCSTETLPSAMSGPALPQPREKCAAQLGRCVTKVPKSRESHGGQREGGIETR